MLEGFYGIDYRQNLTFIDVVSLRKMTTFSVFYVGTRKKLGNMFSLNVRLSTIYG
ncbi:hypothetical protein ACS0TY_024387 [Phlomoides rotata]